MPFDIDFKTLRNMSFSDRVSKYLICKSDIIQYLDNTGKIYENLLRRSSFHFSETSIAILIDISLFYHYLYLSDIEMNYDARSGYIFDKIRHFKNQIYDINMIGSFEYADNTVLIHGEDQEMKDFFTFLILSGYTSPFLISCKKL